jgi:uncharacterized membrane protein
MIRTALWALAGVLFGIGIHLVVVLVLPAYATHDVWSKVVALNTKNRITVLPAVAAGQANTFGLDPEFSYALCQIDLRNGPGIVTGIMPEGFWSLAVFDRSGTIAYSTTNRDGIGQTLDLGIFNPAQTRLLAEQQLNVSEGLLIVESAQDDIFVLIRSAPPYPAVRARYEAALTSIGCSNLKS